MQPGLALTDDDEKNLEEIYTLLASPSIAHTHTSQERYDPVQFCLLFQKWPEEKRFPRMSESLPLKSKSRDKMLTGSARPRTYTRHALTVLRSGVHPRRPAHGMRLVSALLLDQSQGHKHPTGFADVCQPLPHVDWEEDDDGHEGRRVVEGAEERTELGRDWG